MNMIMSRQHAFNSFTLRLYGVGSNLDLLFLDCGGKKVVKGSKNIIKYLHEVSWASDAAKEMLEEMEHKWPELLNY